jgi:hypothetical protein
MTFSFWHRRKREQELDEELRSHLQMAERDRLERGETPDQARGGARREFGNVSLIKQVTREMWGWASVEQLMQDLRYGIRMLLKSPGFTAVAILTLALGIGANTALFSVVNGVLLKPLPYPHPEQLVWLAESKPNFDTGSISFPNFRDWQKDNRSFSGMAISRGGSFNLTGQGEAEQLRGQFITSDLFTVLGVNPLMGRAFAPREDDIGAAPIAMISEALWRRKLGGSQDALGKNLNLDGMGYTIVGVVPASFDLSLGGFRDIDVYVPVGQWSNPMLPKRGAGLGFHGIGRLKPGVSFEQARADMARVSSNLTAAYPDTNTGIGASLLPLKQTMVGHVSKLLVVLLGAVGFVLLIACVNVANLMLARATARARICHSRRDGRGPGETCAPASDGKHAACPRRRGIWPVARGLGHAKRAAPSGARTAARGRCQAGRARTAVHGGRFYGLRYFLWIGAGAENRSEEPARYAEGGRARRERPSSSSARGFRCRRNGDGVDPANFGRVDGAKPGRPLAH